MASIYTSITDDSLDAARVLAFDELQRLTDGKAEKAIALALMYKEVDDILKENEKQVY